MSATVGRRDLGRLASRPRKDGKAVADELLQARRDRQLIRLLTPTGALQQCSADLERVERIATRGAVETSERPPRQLLLQPRREQAVEICRFQRLDSHAADAALGQGALEVERDYGTAVEAPRNEQADPLALQAPGHKGERAPRRMIEPLNVVDPDEYRAFSCDRAEHRKRAERDRPRERLLALRFPAH
jgi:hypothetical protein